MILFYSQSVLSKYIDCPKREAGGDVFLILIPVSGIYQFMSDYLTWGKYMELVRVGNSFRLLVATLYNEALLLAIEGTMHILLMV